MLCMWSCRVLSDNRSRKLTYWNTWSLVGGTLGEGLRCVALFKRCITGGRLRVFKRFAPFDS